jgi:hypothetical protein
MAYKIYTSVAADQLKKELQDLKRQLSDLERAAKPDPKRIEVAKANVAAKAKAAGKKIADDMEDIRKMGNEHFRNVDQWLGECERGLSVSAAAAQRYKESFSNDDLREACLAEPYIKKNHEAAVQDSSDFGKAWMVYRIMNPTTDAHLGISPDDARDFATKRTQLMEAQKGYSEKIQRMELLRQKAEAVRTLAKTAALAMTGDVKVVQAESARLAKSVDDIVKAMEDPNNKSGLSGLQQNCQSLHTQANGTGAVTMELYTQLKSVLTNAIAIHKSLNEQAKTVKDLIRKAKDLVGQNANLIKDATIKQTLDQADANHLKALNVVAQATKLIQQATEDIGKIYNRVKDKK